MARPDPPQAPPHARAALPDAPRDVPRDAAAVRIAPESPASADSRTLMAELSEILTRLTGASGRASFAPADMLSPRARFVVARDAGNNLLGCGAFRPLREGVGEVKRMYARRGTKAVGAAILAHLEEEARRLGYRELWLETRRVNERAVGFYERNGYVRRPNFGKYAGNEQAVCFGKKLPGPPAALSGGRYTTSR